MCESDALLVESEEEVFFSKTDNEVHMGLRGDEHLFGGDIS